MCKDPEDARLILKEMGGLPNFCQVCQRPTIFPRPDISKERACQHGDDTFIFCSDGCQEIFMAEPEHYQGYKNFYDLYEEKELSEVIQELGFVREDGKTLMAQPELEPKRLWTLDDIRKIDYVVKRPPMPKVQ